MASYTSKDIRNLALVGHGGCGKTTLVERILETTKTIGRMGSVEDGNTVCDFEPEEKAHRHSLNSAIVHLDYDSRRFNIIDTTGYPDFIGQAISALPAVETVILVVDGQKGIENVTRRMMRLAESEGAARAIIVNKIDHADDLETLVEQIRESFGKECLPMNLPTGGGQGVVRCFFSDEEADTDFGSVHETHAALVEQIVEVDDQLMEKYLDAGEIATEEIVGTFTKAMSSGHLVPIFFTSAREGVGITELLDVIAKLFPSPVDHAVKRFLVSSTADDRSKDGDTTNEERSWAAVGGEDAPFVAHVFRVTTDPFVGKLSAFRVHQGSIETGASVQIDDQRKLLRLPHIFQLQGKDPVECHKAIPGDIIAVAKIEEMHYDAVLHSGLDFASIRVRPVPQPKPMFGLAVRPTKRGDESKISNSLRRLSEEDPTFEVRHDPATKELVMRGIGELHLRIMIEKLKNRFNIEVATSPPRIAYKETISAKAQGHHRHKKQTGGAGQFGEVYMRVEPIDVKAEDDFEFVDDTFGGSIPRQFLPAIEKGVRKVLSDGCVAGYPMHGVRVSVYDGKHHPVDSKEVAFVTAGRKAFIDAVSKARPVLLEPYVQMEITAPQEYMGELTGDLAGRRGRIQGTDTLPGGQSVITAVAPLSEVMTYASALKAMTQGTGSFAMEYSHDEQTPANIQAEVVAMYKPKKDED